VPFSNLFSTKVEHCKSQSHSIKIRTYCFGFFSPSKLLFEPSPLMCWEIRDSNTTNYRDGFHKAKVKHLYSQLYRSYPSSSPFLCVWATLNKCSTAQSFSSGLKYHCTRKESQMALHQRRDKHSFLSLPFIPIHLRVRVPKYMRFTATLCSRGSNERNLLCYRAVSVMHTVHWHLPATEWEMCQIW